MVNPLVPLIDIVFQIFLIFFFLRIFINQSDARQNQVFAAIAQVTEPVLSKTRMFFRYRSSHYDLSPLLPLLLLLVAEGFIMGVLNPATIGQGVFHVLSSFLNWLFQVYAVIIIVTSLTPGYVANPIVSFFMKVSEPLVNLTRKVIVFRSNGWRFLSLISLVVLFVLLQSCVAFIVSLGSDFGVGVLFFFLANSLGLLVQLTTFFTIIIIVGALMSWFSPDHSNPLVQFITIVTSPIMSPIQRIMPNLGGIDISPLIAIFLLQFLNGLGNALVNSIVL